MNTIKLNLLLLMFIVSTKGVRIFHSKTSEIDTIVEDLQRDVWDSVEMPCLSKTLELLNGVKNSTLWATWVWDSNQYPVGVLYGNSHVLGNYDQCLRPPWLATHPHLRTQYCTADVTITDNDLTTIGIENEINWDPYDSSERYIKTPTQQSFQFNQLHWSLCVPESCHPHSVSKILKHVYQRAHFSLVSAEPNITVARCQTAGVKYEYSTEFYAFIVFILLLIATTLLSTYLQSSETKNSDQQGLNGRIYQFFCLKRNYNSLIKLTEDEINVMNGMKFLSAFGVVFLHTCGFFAIMPTVNYLDLEKEFETGILRKILHGEVVVDTFFAMSGILHMRVLMKKNRSPNDLLQILLKRYIRLLGPLAVSVFYLMAVSHHVNDGPLWSKMCVGGKSVCSDNWIWTLLMLNADIKNSCHLVTWYISCDYQLTILGTLLFYIYQKNKRLGVTVFTIVSILSLIIPGLLTYMHQLPALPFDTLWKLRNMRENVGFEYNYAPSYVRASSYLVGFCLGFVISIYKPKLHREVISKKWSVLGTFVCSIVMLFILKLGQYFYQGVKYNPMEVAVTVSLNRAVWAVAVCGVIAFCEYGTVPIVGGFLGLPVFTVLSRLSYGIYLIHLFFLQRFVYASRTPFTYGFFIYFTISLGVTVMSAFGSFLLWLLVEAPCINIANTLLNKSEDGKTTKNGQTEYNVTTNGNASDKQYGCEKTKES